MIVYIKDFYKESFIKAGKNKKNKEFFNELIEKGLFFVEEYNEYLHKHPTSLTQLTSTDISKSIGKITSVNWDHGYIDLKLNRAHNKYSKFTLKAVPIIFTHHFPMQSDTKDLVTKICIEVLEG